MQAYLWVQPLKYIYTCILHRFIVSIQIAYTCKQTLLLFLLIILHINAITQNRLIDQDNGRLTNRGTTT